MSDVSHIQFNLTSGSGNNKVPMAAILDVVKSQFE